MNLFSSWAKKNKRDSSARMSSQMLGSISESQSSLNINIGAGGLLNTGSSDKETYYRELRTKISDETLILMESVFKLHNSRKSIFSRLEDEGVSLMYLVALGITSEEDVQSYLTLKERGIDIGNMLQDAKNNTWDEVYAREILSGEEAYPILRDIYGNPVQYVEDTERPTTPTSSIQIQKEEPKEPIHIKVMGQKEVDVTTEPEEQVTKDVGLAADEVASTADVLQVTTSEERAEVNTDKEDVKKLDWFEKLDQIINEAETSAKHDEEDERLKQEEDEREPEEVVKPRLKQVYILAESVAIPKLEGYEFFMVKGVQDFNNFTSHRDNLLVITQQVPKRLANHFLNWLKGVMSSGDRYRVVTLKSSAVPHDIVEAEVNLTQEDLDNYYGEKDAKSYMGTGVGSFMDISSALSDESKM
ncbi:hypothetical protein FT641_19510 [Bacillus paranthracis]|uniref:hypothetical protein n=1 Tax=Bacillus paranthracis TaxID=2026186 RepID=UPI00187A8A0F|nr:hypothetical protein [Bacillus paranthracis]MBE7114246.1 hypothetical protein [Bacillus paranthracis]MBE7154881.1 hypothetical protein [Bacillus paranthracis]